MLSPIGRPIVPRGAFCRRLLMSASSFPVYRRKDSGRYAACRRKPAGRSGSTDETSSRTPKSLTVRRQWFSHRPQRACLTLWVKAFSASRLSTVLSPACSAHSPCVQRRAVRAHQAGDVRSGHLTFGEQFEGAQHGVVEERAALHHHMSPSSPESRSLITLYSALRTTEIAQARRDVLHRGRLPSAPA